ncbi:MAG: polymer-forming cytoskeletal protein [Sulfurospirillaceae bacterium]|jgi:cytoskeletal protein CcmA (bactofilin family)|nr:polymer-forming cytoskeletal protein [Sulfurospirillaceae bacterium]MDD2826816.1 polymer-forming cytoskeletal protein [Sulfurospirillaceae bacterium]
MLRQTRIAAGTHIEGTLKMQNELHLYGTMEGEIHSSETVIIEHGATFTGTINAPTLLIRGNTHGEIDCDLVKIMANGYLHGTIKSFMLIIEAKGHFEGTRTVRAKEWDENLHTKNGTEFDTENILL